MDFDVFISYHTKTSLHITEAVCNALENKKIKCWYAPRNISGSYAKSIVEAINKCKVFLLILNKEASYSEDVLNEINLATERVRRKEEISVIPFQISEEEISADAKYYLGRIHWVDAITPPMEKRVQELTTRILYVLNKNIENNEKDQILKSNYIPSITNFVGRKKELQQIKETLDKTGQVFIWGMGGIGKSELVKAYINENINRYNKIIFAYFEENIISTLTKESNFKITNFQRKLDENGNQETLEEYFKRKLAKINELSDENTLIVIDNFDTEKDPHLKDLLKGSYHIIFTTRNDFSSYKVPIIKIGPLEETTNLTEIFENSYKLKTDQKDAIVKIINLIGRHTLTINLIASVMNENRIKPDKMLENLKSGQIDIEGTLNHNLENYDSLYNCLSNVFKVSNLTSEEKQILKLLNLFSLEGISFEDFMELCDLSSGITVNKLIKRSIINYNITNDYISLHPLISSLIDKEMKITLDEAKVLIKNISQKYDWNSKLDVIEKYAPICIKLYEKFKDFDESVAQEFVIISNFVRDINNFVVAQAILNRAREIYEKNQNIDGLINVYKSLGYIFYIKEKNMKENRKYTKKAMHLIENNENYYQEYGDLYKNLAIEYLEDGNLNKAKKSIEQAQIYLEKTGNENLSLLGSYYGTLSKIYVALKEYNEALKTIDKYYEILFSVFKEENLDISSAYKLKGEVYLKLGEYDKAINQLNKALEIRLKYRNNNSITVLRVMEPLADSYLKNKNYQNALEIYEKMQKSIEENFSKTKNWLERINSKIEMCQGSK